LNEYSIKKWEWDETLDNDAMLYLMQKKREREQSK